MEVVPPGRTGDVFSLGPVMCHDRSKRMAMLDLMVHGDVDQIVGNRSNTVSRNVVKSITRMMNPMPRI